MAMNTNTTITEILGIYLWVFIIGLVGGFLNIGQRNDKPASHKTINLIIGTLSSIFFGWISFEVVFFIYASEKLALAACGFFAWKGADWINVLIDKVIDNKLNKTSDETKE